MNEQNRITDTLSRAVLNALGADHIRKKEDAVLIMMDETIPMEERERRVIKLVGKDYLDLIKEMAKAKE